METPPEDYIDTGLDVMSNYDGVIDTVLAERLMAERITASYPAWNFHGTIWWWSGNFYCKIMRHGCHVGTKSAPILEELKHEISEVYGYD